ncbi:PepSY domain-containing protein [Alteromonas facilis]|uniref:PepSY domain-containing protein n=1 Tax=Alteromonas facilis TaxID=2048004 RepID=UPI0023E803BF|nr:PepSY domain-containing protein [Alteromonas facilis]
MKDNRLFNLLIAVLMSLTLSGIAMPAYAQQKEKQDKTEKIDKTQAAERARAELKGRVLKVEKRQDNYRVKVLQKSGRVVSVDVDKKSGAVKPSKDKKEKR